MQPTSQEISYRNFMIPGYDKSMIIWVRWMAQCLKAFPALPEDVSSIPSTMQYPLP